MQRSVNYIFFGILFAVLSFLHVYQIFLVDAGSYFHRFFYSIIAIGQTFIEVGVLMLIGHFLVRKYPKTFHPLFIIGTFVIFLIHLLDFPLVRIMGWSIWYVLDFVAAESLDNFIEMLLASNITLQTWFVGGIAALVLPVIGVLFFRFTDQIAQKKAVKISYPWTTISIIAVALFLSVFDFRTGTIISPDDDSYFLRALPWKTTFFTEPFPMIAMPGTMRPPLEKTEDIAHLDLTTTEKPPIFLFVIESLRADHITPEIAPTFAEFKENNISFDRSFSGANGSQNSWYSIFHSRYPFDWQCDKQRGSLALQVLKKAGYQVHVYSSARLAYYQMEDILFGKDKYLADTFFDASQGGQVPAHQCDLAGMGKLFEDLQHYNLNDGHLFVVFFDATHFDYSWPEEQPSLFGPIVEQINYFKVAFNQENINGIKNRYCNAIFYLDSLFSQFCKKVESMDNAAIIVTGDHGESFYEDGHLFHASNLSRVQTRVPILMRFGSAPFPQDKNRLTSHVDIFPSILNYVFQKPISLSAFDGESIFQPRKNPFVITARYNASRPPFEFAIHTDDAKVILRFPHEKEITKSHFLYILGKKQLDDTPLSYDINALEKEFAPAFHYLFTQK
ncbi:MAG: sulfatase-like hydrolase/transferase [Verrucomicrobia bacterium]|nr:sulfatase-like hydrolase/transferase [Verrucomicrobiota bacterium]